jgi:hypothetical protein
VNHLKWEKGKYRICNIKLKSTEEVGEMLNIKKFIWISRSKKTVLFFGNLQLNGKFM